MIDVPIKKKIIFLFAVLLSTCCYSQKYSIETEEILIKSGENRKELELFLEYCLQSSDSTKWNAACFLINNMDIHYSEVNHWVDSAKNVVEFNELEYSNFDQSIKALENLIAKRGLKPLPQKKYDIHNITSKYLINNLELAFECWQQPHNAHISFEEFCEYILPYRNVTEPLEDWRNKFKEILAPQNADIFKQSNFITSQLLSKHLAGFFVSSYSYESKKNPVSFLSPSQLLFRKRGHCEDIVNFITLGFKSQGIPCRIDMVPFHGTSTGRHFWNATIDENHELIPFDVSNEVDRHFFLAREPAKVITLTYAKQAEALASFIDNEEIPRGFLRNRNIIDVTDHYWPTKDISCELTRVTTNSIAYLAVLNGLKWQAVHWGKVNKDNWATFKKMGCGVIYLPMIYEQNKLIPAANPILLFENGDQLSLDPQKDSTHTIKLYEEEKYLKYRPNKRYRLFYWDNRWKLLAQKITKEDDKHLDFENVPKNALLLMVPEYSLGKERPFYITSAGERLWW